METAALIIQTLSVLVAIGASIVALRIASKNRRDALRQDHLMFELEVAVRLTENLVRGGSTDPLERQRMGAEALALAGALERYRIPGYWDKKIGPDQKLLGLLDDPEMPDWQRNAIEAQLAVNEILREIAKHEGRS